MGIFSDGSLYDVPEGLIYSFPIHCKGGFKYEVIKGLKVDDFSKEKMVLTAKELQEEKADAFA